MICCIVYSTPLFCAGDCEQAICGGVNCMLTPDMFVLLSKARLISPTGQCHTFSDKADGYTRGEGCGVVILKRLKDVSALSLSLSFPTLSYFRHRSDRNT